MPRLKKSPGKVRFRTPDMAEFQRMMFFELANTMQWNKDTIKLIRSTPQWEFKSPQWGISYDGKDIIVVSDEPKVWIRQGLYILMGSAKLIFEGQF